jgi:hypothetical protein
VPTTLSPLRIRKILGRHQWAPPQQFGDSGWTFVRHDKSASVIVSTFTWDDIDWIHASIAGHTCGYDMPTYEDLTVLHRAVFDNMWAYQVFAPQSEHVNIHPNALHLWGRADGEPCMPNFGQFGTI